MSNGFRSWHDAKVLIEHATTISHDTLHLVVGLLVWLALAILFRRTLRAPLPLLATFAIAAINEAVDLWVEIWPQQAMQIGEGVKDLLTTMAIPVILYATFRAVPGLIGPAPARRRRAKSR